MDCPVCKSAMITLELADVEIDHCVHCGGIWLDSGELELLVEDPVRAQSLLASFPEDPAAAESARPCPICDAKMAKIVVAPSRPPLLIDKCRRSHGLWFDRDELQNVLKLGRLDEDGRMQRLLADMFGGQREETEVKPDS
jgi:Zn-finger nucleic acid-binding protein